MSATVIASGQGELWRRRVAPVVLPLIVVLLSLLLIEWLSGAGALPKSMPSPSQVWATLIKKPSIVGSALWETGWKAFLGYIAAMLVALCAASMASLLPVLRGSVYGFGVGLHSIPLIATVPLLALWLGTGAVTHAVIAGLACYFPMLVGAMQGFRAYENSSMELFHVYSASRWQVLRFLVLPSSLPYLFAGFKLAAPVAVLGALTAEWAGADSGLGAIMLAALFTYDISQVWLTVLAACILAGAAYGAGAALEQLVGRWGGDVTLEE
jgi:ABC-type nitrate/sulfonate/bicarbonate transport system permease component